MAEHEFKPGDRVVIVSRWRSEAATIDRVTSTGRLVIDRRQFNPDGWERGRDTYDGRCRLVPMSPEWARRLAARRLAEILSREAVKCKDWPRVKIDAVATALAAEYPEGER